MTAHHSRRRFLRTSWQMIAAGFFLPWASRECLAWDENSKDTDPADFLKFLDGCTLAERVQLAQSLHMFRDLEEDDFGRCGLPPFDDFADKEADVTPKRPIRPKSFNEVTPALVAAAIEDKRVDKDVVDKYEILRKLLGCYYNGIGYWFTNRDRIDYHEIVRWVAKHKGIDSKLVADASTYQLEQEVYKAYLIGIWDRLDAAGRRDLLEKIEQATGTQIENRDEIAEMSGAEAIKALGQTPVMIDWKFYATAAVLVLGGAALLGASLPVTIGTTIGVSVAAGPPGWGVASLCAVGYLAWRALPNADKTASFVLAMHAIKANRLHAAEVTDDATK